MIDSERRHREIENEGMGGVRVCMEVSDTSSSDARLYLIEAEMMIVNGIIGRELLAKGGG